MTPSFELPRSCAVHQPATSKDVSSRSSLNIFSSMNLKVVHSDHISQAAVISIPTLFLSHCYNRPKYHPNSAHKNTADED